MLRYTTDRARLGLVALYDIRPGNGAGQFLQPRSRTGRPLMHAGCCRRLLVTRLVDRDDYELFVTY